MNIIKENSPHLRRKANVTRMMTDVLLALIPTLIMAFVAFPLEATYTLLISLAVMLSAEFVFIGLKNMMPKDGQKHTFKEKFIHSYKGTWTINNILSTAITAVIFTLIMPALPAYQLYYVIIGALAGIVFGKLVFGGLGQNIFNPAAVGMIFAKLCFGGNYKPVQSWFWDLSNTPDVLAGATPLSKGGILNNAGEFTANLNNFSLQSMVLGQIPGTMGEICKITIVVGLIYLLIRRSADYRIVVSYLGSFILFSIVAGLSIWGVNPNINPFAFTAYYLLSGGVLFGATFMLTDPVTSPINAPSRYMYGIIAAISTIFIRLFAALPEGVGFSILIANMLSCLLDHYEWSSPKFNKKNIIAISLLIAIPVLLIFLIITYGGVLHV